MKKLAVSLFVLLFCQVVFSQQQNIPILKYEQLEAKIKSHNKDILVVNFWSTTCAPCVKELPYFENVNKKYGENPNFKMLLISLDRPKDIEKIKQFLSSKNITSEVLLLDDIKRMNTWIPRFEEDWGGEIPVTLFYKNSDKIYFHNGEISQEELEQKINEIQNL